MIAPTHTLVRYLLEDLRISHVGVSSSSSSSLFSVLLNIGIHIQGISRDESFSCSPHAFTDNQSAALSI